jgi:glyoxylase-like metal-dependent hydrolase (beta-lactamase superfamily II)
MKFITLVVGILNNNCYILSGNDADCIVIDPGGDCPAIEGALRTAGLTCRDVLLTHGHFDHWGAARALQEAGAKIHLHEADMDRLNETFGVPRARSFTPDAYLTDGQILRTAGLDIKVIHTPGHTLGGVCFLIGDMLFSGDTLFAGDVGKTSYPWGSFELLARNIREKLYVLPPETKVFPGHEESSTIGRERLYNAAVRAE